MMFKVYFINHMYYSPKQFDTADEAIAYGKGKGFDFRVDFDGGHGSVTPVASWSIISGLTRYQGVKE